MRSKAVDGDAVDRRTPDAVPERVSAELDGWLRSEANPTLGALTKAFGHESFAIAFVVLLGVPALPIPTGGATHLLELIAILLALRAPRRAFGADLAAAALGWPAA